MASSKSLLFSPRTYYRLIELYNLAVWPAQLAGIAIGFAILGLLIGARRHQERIIADPRILAELQIRSPLFTTSIAGSTGFSKKC